MLLYHLWFSWALSKQLFLQYGLNYFYNMEYKFWIFYEKHPSITERIIHIQGYWQNRTTFKTWKALFYDNDNTSDRKKNQSENNRNCFTMKSRKWPPQVESMKGFEKDLTKMIENIQFRKVSSAFLLKIDEDIKNIKSSKNVFISRQNRELLRN